MSARLRVLVIIVVVFTALGAFLWLRSQGTGLINDTIYFGNDGKATGSVSANPAVSPEALNTTTPAPEITAPSKEITLPGNYVGRLKLIIPAVGVRPDQLLDTFTDARSEGRVHDAIDIPASAGTPVVATADGEIIKLFQSERGGTTIYQLSTDKKLVFYYAHLQRYADGLAVGKFARQGEVIAYVGDTGNAGTGNYHLHFSISVVADPNRYWEGTNINPYPILNQNRER
jgi:peptidoglycan LD-endopeptidase LytH